MDVMTKPCRMCGNNGWVFGVDSRGYMRWNDGEADIQDALPGLDADQRELLMSGTHAHCWEQMWGKEDV